MPDPSVAGKASVEARKFSPIGQIVQMQARLLARVMDEATPPKEQASCACAWQKLEAQKLILKGKPLPGSLRPVSQPRKAKRSATTPIEPSTSTQEDRGDSKGETGQRVKRKIEPLSASASEPTKESSPPPEKPTKPEVK